MKAKTQKQDSQNQKYDDHKTGWEVYQIMYTLWLFNSSPWYRWPIEIDGLAIKNGDFFHGKRLVITR